MPEDDWDEAEDAAWDEPGEILPEVGGDTPAERLEARLARLEELWVRVVERVDAAEDAAETRAAITEWLLHRVGEAVGAPLPPGTDEEAAAAAADPRGAWAGLRGWVVQAIEEALDPGADPAWVERLEAGLRGRDRAVSAAVAALDARLESAVGRLEERAREVERRVTEVGMGSEERVASIGQLIEETRSILRDVSAGTRRDLAEARVALAAGIEAVERDAAGRDASLREWLAEELGAARETLETRTTSLREALAAHDEGEAERLGGIRGALAAHDEADSGRVGAIREAIAAHDEAGAQRMNAAAEAVGGFVERIASDIASVRDDLSRLVEERLREELAARTSEMLDRIGEADEAAVARGRARDDAIRRLGLRLTTELALAQEQIADEVRVQLRRQLATVERELRDTTSSAVDQAVSRVRRILRMPTPERLAEPAEATPPLAEVDRLIERMRQTEPS